MKEFVEKLNKRLKKELYLADEEKRRCDSENKLQFDSAKGYANGIAIAIDIVNQVAEKYNDGWIPCGERMPADNADVLVWHSGQDMHCVAWYNSASKIWYSNDFEITDSKYIVAWQPLPKPYE